MKILVVGATGATGRLLVEQLLIGQTDEAIEWTVVRPDNLSDEDTVTEYSIFP
jgi:nucleoside-diphosphate-sugar epimerase